MVPYVRETNLANLKVDNVAEALRVAALGRVGHAYRLGVDRGREMREQLAKVSRKALEFCTRCLPAVPFRQRSWSAPRSGGPCRRDHEFVATC